MARTKTVGYNRVSPPRRWLAVMLGLALAALLLGGAFWAGYSTAPKGGVAGAEKQTAMPVRDGVPVPARHSPAGAVTAAQNFQIAGFRVAAGTLEADVAAHVLLEAEPAPAARQILTAPSGSREQLAQRRSTFAPVSGVVRSYQPGRAVVLVWGVAAASSKLTPSPAGTEDWGSATVTLAWSGDQWRVVDQTFDPGPWPVRSDQRHGQSQGDFGFRFQESEQGWAYVPEP